MIVRPNKPGFGIESCSQFPNTNWYKNEPDNLIIDESTLEGLALKAKLEQLKPNCEFITKDNVIVDIIEILPNNPKYKKPKPKQSSRNGQQEASLMHILYGAKGKIELATRVIQSRIDEGEKLPTVLLDYPGLVGDELQQVIDSIVPA